MEILNVRTFDDAGNNFIYVSHNKCNLIITIAGQKWLYDASNGRLLIIDKKGFGRT